MTRLAQDSVVILGLADYWESEMFSIIMSTDTTADHLGNGCVSLVAIVPIKY